MGKLHSDRHARWWWWCCAEFYFFLVGGCHALRPKSRPGEEEEEEEVYDKNRAKEDNDEIIKCETTGAVCLFWGIILGEKGFFTLRE